jgi:hypothetical protein
MADLTGRPFASISCTRKPSPKAASAIIKKERDMLDPKIDFEAPARLFQANTNFAQFGDGYRQVTGSQELSTGSVTDLLAEGRAITVQPGKTLFINNVGHGHFFKLEEVEQQQRDLRVRGE